MCFEDGLPSNIYRLARSCQPITTQTLLGAMYEYFSYYLDALCQSLQLPASDKVAMIDGFYLYDAEASASLLAAAFFCLLLAFSVFCMCTARSWFMCTNVVSILVEIIGLMARFISIIRPTDHVAFIISAIFLTLAPSIQAANVYILAGRIISKSTPPEKRNVHTLWFKPQYLTVTFVAQNILAFSTQLFGVALLINAAAGAKEGIDSTPELRRAMHILVFGFSLQLVSLYLFLMLVIRFQIKFMGWLPMLKDTGISSKLLRTIFSVIYLATVLLLVRTIYRLNESVAETSESKSFLVTQEWPFWVFEIFVTAVIYTSYLVPQYPGKWFARGGPLEHDLEMAVTETKTDSEVHMRSDRDFDAKSHETIGMGM